MGKESDKFIVAIGKGLAELERDFNASQTVIEEAVTIFSEWQMAEQSAAIILNDTYKGDEDQADNDPKYKKLVDEAARLKPQAERVEQQSDRLIRLVDTNKRALLKLVGDFETYVKQKEKSKNPFKKKSVGSSKKFIEATKKAINDLQ
ncbi:Hypothetical protein PBC10988_37710 [Planctomycetales bacterium 10988]|nr:Hypothetical protein PBC10988_37710 [Planctomycetales bacterium 10988]